MMSYSIWTDNHETEVPTLAAAVAELRRLGVDEDLVATVAGTDPTEYIGHELETGAMVVCIEGAEREDHCLNGGQPDDR